MRKHKYILQYGERGDENDEITWCQDKINEHDAEYVLVSELQEVSDELQKILLTIMTSRTTSVGATENTYTPQFNVERINKIYNRYFR